MTPKYTLLELNKDIQEKIKTGFSSSVWVIAEISELKVNRNGHCYIELIEKDIINDTIIARSRATIWAFTYRIIKPYFESTTGHELTPGIKILVQANVEFHELYGLSINITDIDPNYTIGELAQRKAEIIKKLEEEGVINMNKEIPFPLVPQKIAVISSQNAAGYQDFINQLENNSLGYKFYTKLFPSTMQGNSAEGSIIRSLESIYDYEDFFDLVVIIRGGGARADLDCFNSYLLSSNIAQFPLPVLTGIGHDKDESIVDIIAYQKLKTPTAVAEFITEKTSLFEEKLNFLKDSVTNNIYQHIQERKDILNHYISLVNPIVKRNIDRLTYHLNMIKENIKNYTIQILYKKSFELTQYTGLLKIKTDKKLQNQKHIQENIKSRIELLNPENILKRGYSITYYNGKKLTDIKDIKENNDIKTKLYLGTIHSKIIKKQKNN